MPCTRIATGQNADGTLQLFAATYCTNVVRATSQLVHAPTNWGDWVTLGAGEVSQFAIGRDLEGRIDGFALATDGRCYHIQQKEPSIASFQWTDIGAIGWKQIEL